MSTIRGEAPALLPQLLVLPFDRGRDGRIHPPLGMDVLVRGDVVNVVPA